MKRSCCQISPGMCLQFISQPDRQRKELLNKPINGSGSDEGFTDNAFLTSLWSFWTVLRMWNLNVQLFERLGENGNKHETNVNKNLTSNEGCSHIIPERTRWKQNLLYELIRRSDGRSWTKDEGAVLATVLVLKGRDYFMLMLCVCIRSCHVFRHLIDQYSRPHLLVLPLLAASTVPYANAANAASCSRPSPPGH